MEKQKARLYNWNLYRSGSHVFLEGVVCGHPKARDGLNIRTSPVRSLDFENKIAETKNTTYELAENFAPVYLGES
jgi:hypothetical protein